MTLPSPCNGIAERGCELISHVMEGNGAAHNCAGIDAMSKGDDMNDWNCTARAQHRSEATCTGEAMTSEDSTRAAVAELGIDRIGTAEEERSCVRNGIG